MTIREYSRRFISAFKHAFSTRAQEESFLPEEIALMERIATAVVKRGMSTPTLIFLESMGPLNFIGSQALYCLCPIFSLVCNAKELEKIAKILEKRDSIPTFMHMIETKEKELSR